MTSEEIERLLKSELDIPVPEDRLSERLRAELRRRPAADLGGDAVGRPAQQRFFTRWGVVAAASMLAVVFGLVVTRPHGEEPDARPAAQARAESDVRAREWIERLRSENGLERDEARRRLKEMGRAALPELAKAIHDRDPEVAGAAREIRRFIEISGILTAPLLRAMPGLQERLAAGDDRLWCRTVIAAAAVDAEGRRVHPELREEDLDPLLGRAVRGAQSPPERLELCQAIVRLGLRQGIPELVKLLSDDDVVLRWKGAELARLKALAEAIPALRTLLADKEPAVRGSAIRALGELGDRASAPGLRRLLDDAAVAGIAAEALARLGVADAVPQIVEVLDRGDAAARSGALRALTRLGCRAVIPKAVVLLHDQDSTVRFDAAQALSVLDAREAVAEIIRRLREESPHRSLLIRALGALGAREAIPEIRRFLRSKDAGDRMEAASALARLGALEAASDLTPLLHDSDPLVRGNALLALGSLQARSAAPEIALLLRDPQPEFRRRSLEALRKLGARETASEVRALLSDSDDGIRLEALTVLGDWGLENPTPGLLRFLKHGDPEVRRSAASGLGRLGRREAIPALLPLLQDPYDLARLAAAVELCRLGSNKAAPAILQLASEEPPRTAYPWCLLHLNLLRQPEAWRKLGKPLTVELQGSNLEVLSEIAKQAGLPLKGLEDLSREDQAWLSLPCNLWSRHPGQPLGDVLASVLGPLSAVVERDRIRIVPRKDALAFWRSWWEQSDAGREK